MTCFSHFVQRNSSRVCTCCQLLPSCSLWCDFQSLYVFIYLHPVSRCGGSKFEPIAVSNSDDSRCTLLKQHNSQLTYIVSFLLCSLFCRSDDDVSLVPLRNLIKLMVEYFMYIYCNLLQRKKPRRKGEIFPRLSDAICPLFFWFHRLVVFSEGKTG